MTTCVFCGSPGPMTREHVFPQWLRALFPGLDKVDFTQQLRTTEGDKRRAYSGRPFSVAVKDVCRRCNNDWLSQMETDAKDILTPLMLDHSRTLTASEEYTVALWATKTILTVQGANIDEQRALGPNSYEWVYKHRAPLPDSLMWLGRYRGRGQWPLALHEHAIVLNQLGDPPPGPNATTNAFNVVLAIGHLLVWTFGHKLVDGSQMHGDSNKRLILIWRSSGADIHWPPAQSFDTDDELETLSRQTPTEITHAPRRGWCRSDRSLHPVGRSRHDPILAALDELRDALLG
jgi:hypothetical protein